MMQEILNKRAIIPDDATSLDINSIDFGDASNSIACVAIYARFQRKCGICSCQLVLARPRLTPEGMSQPRAELYWKRGFKLKINNIFFQNIIDIYLLSKNIVFASRSDVIKQYIFNDLQICSARD